MNIATLPEGHDWKEFRSSLSNTVSFECTQCGARFIHDLTNNSTSFEAGDGSCETREEAIA